MPDDCKVLRHTSFVDAEFEPFLSNPRKRQPLCEVDRAVHLIV